MSSKNESKFNHRDFIDSQRETLDDRTVYIGWLKFALCRPGPDGDYRFLTRDQHMLIRARENLKMMVNLVELEKRYP